MNQKKSSSKFLGFLHYMRKNYYTDFNEATERLEIYKAYMKEFEQGGSTKQIVDVNGKTFYSPNALTHLDGDKYR